jgi:hypothetical protein
LYQGSLKASGLATATGSAAYIITGETKS